MTVDVFVGGAIALAGVIVQAVIADRRARIAEQRALEERRRQELRNAVRNVLTAFVRFREQQYLKVEACRTGSPAEVLELRPARWDARSVLTTAIDELYATTADQRLLDAAETARLLAIKIGDAAEPGRVDDARVEAVGQQAREVHTELRLAARSVLGT